MNENSGFFNVTPGVPEDNQKLPVLVKKQRKSRTKKPAAMLIQRDQKQNNHLTMCGSDGQGLRGN